MTLIEIDRNLGEMRSSIGEEHAREIRDMMLERAQEEFVEAIGNFEPFIGPPPPVEDADEPLSMGFNLIGDSLTEDLQDAVDELLGFYIGEHIELGSD